MEFSSSTTRPPPSLEFTAEGDVLGLSRAWEAFLLLPRRLLYRPPRRGLIAKSSLIEWLQFFHGTQLVTSAGCQSSADGRHPRFPDVVGDVKTTVAKLPAARQALEGAAVAPRREATRAALTDPAKRPPVPREPLPRHLTEAVSFRFGSCLVQPAFEKRKARRLGWSLWHDQRTFAATVGQSARYGTFLADGSHHSSLETF